MSGAGEWFHNRWADLNEEDRAFARTVMPRGILEVSPHLGPVSTFSAHGYLDPIVPMDDVIIQLFYMDFRGRKTSAEACRAYWFAKKSGAAFEKRSRPKRSKPPKQRGTQRALAAAPGSRSKAKPSR